MKKTSCDQWSFIREAIVGKLPNFPFQLNLSRAGAGPPGVWGEPKWATNLQDNHMKPLVPKTLKSVQPFSQKMATKPFWPLINIILWILFEGPS